MNSCDYICNAANLAVSVCKHTNLAVFECKFQIVNHFVMVSLA
jgi:hypothetical protein